MNRTLLGLGVLGVVAAVAVAASLVDFGALIRQVERRAPVTVALYYGGEKAALLENPAVLRILESHGVTLDATKAGSIEMATTLSAAGKDCLWPSNMVAVEFARESGKPVKGDETIFNSPIVFYAWAEVAEALVAQGVVTERDDGFLMADVAGIGRLIEEKARWKEDLGLDIYGPFKVFSTHPAKSNSGNIWAGLLAIVFNGGSTPNADRMEALLPRIVAYFEAMGYMEASSGDIFENFLKQGMGARPIIVGYENQMIEFLKVNEAYVGTIRDRIRVIYPEPTIFASHPLIALTDRCRRLTEALQDPGLQAVAWSDHGFRTGLIGVQNDPDEIGVARLPEHVDLVVSMPSARVMDAIVRALR